MQNQMKPSNECSYALSIWKPGGGTLQMFIRGGSAPRFQPRSQGSLLRVGENPGNEVAEVQPLTHLYDHFRQLRFSFHIPSIDKWYPFHNLIRTFLPF